MLHVGPVAADTEGDIRETVMDGGDIRKIGNPCRDQDRHLTGAADNIDEEQRA